MISIILVSSFVSVIILVIVLVIMNKVSYTVTNLPYTVKSNHRVKNPFHSLGFIPKP
jgi:hypothetical protein